MSKCKEFKESKSQLKDVAGRKLSSNVVEDECGVIHVVPTETDKVLLELIERLEALEALVKQLKDK